MEHSKHYEEILGYYNGGYWKISRVWNAVGKWITEDEYYEITGIHYPYKSIAEEEAANEENS